LTGISSPSLGDFGKRRGGKTARPAHGNRRHSKARQSRNILPLSTAGTASGSLPSLSTSTGTTHDSSLKENDWTRERRGVPEGLSGRRHRNLPFTREGGGVLSSVELLLARSSISFVSCLCAFLHRNRLTVALLGVIPPTIIHILQERQGQVAGKGACLALAEYLNTYKKARQWTSNKPRSAPSTVCTSFSHPRLFFFPKDFPYVPPPLQPCAEEEQKEISEHHPPSPLPLFSPLARLHRQALPTFHRGLS